MKFEDGFIYDLFFVNIMVKRKHKHKSTIEPQLSANIRAARNSSKQDMVHRMVMTSIESKTPGDICGNVKKIIDDAISVSLWIIKNNLKCATRRHNQKIGNN